MCAPQHVLHLAAQAGVRYADVAPLSYVKANVQGTTTLLEAVARAPLDTKPHVVYASSSSVYGGNARSPFSEEHRVDKPLSLYAATKREGELLANVYHHLHGLSVTSLRCAPARCACASIVVVCMPVCLKTLVDLHRHPLWRAMPAVLSPHRQYRRSQHRLQSSVCVQLFHRIWPMGSAGHGSAGVCARDRGAQPSAHLHRAWRRRARPRLHLRRRHCLRVHSHTFDKPSRHQQKCICCRRMQCIYEVCAHSRCNPQLTLGMASGSASASV